jgi:hypothetical protein
VLKYKVAKAPSLNFNMAGAKTLRKLTRCSGISFPRYNQKFAIPAKEPGLAYRQPPEGFGPDKMFFFKYYRRMGQDNVVRFGEHRLEIMTSNSGLSYVRARMEVH